MRRFLCIAVTFVLCGVTNSSLADDNSAELLLKRFRNLQGFSAQYKEEKSIALLKQPLLSEGRIYYSPKANLLRVTDKPEKSRLLLKGEMLSLQDASGQIRLDLSNKPVVRIFVRSFLDVLRGDYQALVKSYELRFSEGPTWKLRLKPKSKTLRRVIQELIFEGRGNELKIMKIKESNGDTSTSYFSKVSKKKFSAAERKKLFGSP